MQLSLKVEPSESKRALETRKKLDG